MKGSHKESLSSFIRRKEELPERRRTVSSIKQYLLCKSNIVKRLTFVNSFYETFTFF
ncbi:hypothetical protein HMPREF9554_01741 [Treponema phagedenis F0421]|nr:hypothetical protein HMPREF9554_01741 [Treponema phagedenis F0421]